MWASITLGDFGPARLCGTTDHVVSTLAWQSASNPRTRTVSRRPRILERPRDSEILREVDTRAHETECVIILHSDDSKMIITVRSR